MIGYDLTLCRYTKKPSTKQNMYLLNQIKVTILLETVLAAENQSVAEYLRNGAK